jgi:hypothetical protein
MRKKLIPSNETKAQPLGLDVSSLATVLVSSESEDHPVENAFDARRGPGGTYWMASERGEQTIILEFDAPQTIRRVNLEIEEKEASRRQEITLSVSVDAGTSYREHVRQEYNFSPPGATFQREEWQLSADRVTHLRLRIKPDKGETECRATLTSFAVH